MDAIDQAIYERLGDAADGGYRQLKFVPFDPVRKRTEATVEGGGKTFEVMKGEPNTVLSLCNAPGAVDREIEGFASKGYRVIAVARNDGDGWRLIGLIPLYDPLRADSRQTIATAGQMGIAVKMVTGDNEAIAREIVVSSAWGRRSFQLPSLNPRSSRRTGRRWGRLICSHGCTLSTNT